MRLLSRKIAHERLSDIRARLTDQVRSQFEHRAKPCSECDTPGACCLDVHFVNVHISRLEAEAINDALRSLDSVRQQEVYGRIEQAIDKFDLTAEGDTFERKFACPLYDRETGCLVHESGKPVPCIVHACYENKADLPPDHLEADAELAIDRLNTLTYGGPQPWLPLPFALLRSR
jgi:hypothetical protein